MGIVAMDPAMLAESEYSGEYMGLALVIIGVPIFLFGFLFPYIEAWRKTRKEQRDLFCPYCGKPLKFSLSK